jgi:prepilin-type N-terminal cleavage/methylation domain-containing protein/prepilin-type processing-associated H-X9-DG protein
MKTVIALLRFPVIELECSFNSAEAWQRSLDRAAPLPGHSDNLHGVKEWRTGFTLVELLAVVAIIAVLAALLFPVFARVRESGRQAACASNLRQIGAAIFAYAADWDDLLPYDDDPDGSDPEYYPWSRPLEPLLGQRNRGVWRCPSDDYDEKHLRSFPQSESEFRKYSSYTPSVYFWGIHVIYPEGTPYEEMRSLSSVERPVSIIMVCEGDGRFPEFPLRPIAEFYRRLDSMDTYFMSRHQRKGNYLFADGHVKLLAIRQTLVPEVLWDTIEAWDKDYPYYYSENYTASGWKQEDIAKVLHQLNELGIP